jgi:uncharacterized HAD superfamily protein/adenine/guanine phosphoribosyltransferase-like PRPP-binding protein
MNYKSYSALNEDIKNSIYLLHNKKYDLIVGLPRSGMIPAYIIALLLNVECTDLGSYIDNRALKKGGTRKLKRALESPHEAKNVLIVDDSILTGKSLANDLQLIPQELRDRVDTLAIYSSEQQREDVDIVFCHLPTPRLFEWNIFHRNASKLTCFDIDGVLCVDPSKEQNDDGEKYIEFILNAPPLFLPTARIHALVTSRLEKYRPQTEQWMKKNGIEYDHLIMLDLPNKEARIAARAHGKHKANYFQKSDAVFFIESDEKQAIEICQLSGKPVYCVNNNTMYNSDFISVVKNNPKLLRRYLRHFKSKIASGLNKII